MKKASDHSYIVLDGMRGIAAGAVVVFHSNYNLGMSTSLLPSAYLAVDLFFVLSGFVLAHAYERRFSSGMTIWRFMGQRLIRLYPLYLLGILIPPASLLAAKLMGAKVDNTLAWTLSALPWNVWFLPTPESLTNNALLISLDSPAWSLMLELLVNFAFVATWRFLSNSILMLVIVFSALALVLCTIHFGTVDEGATSGSFALGLARVFYSFPLGVLLWRMRRHGLAVGRHAAALPLIPFIGTGLLLGAPYGAGPLIVPYGLLSVILISPALVALGACVEVKTVIVQRTCVLLGAASYGVYVLHEPMMFLFMRMAKLVLGAEFVAWENPISVFFAVVMFAISLILYKVYDAPIRAWLKLLLEHPAKRRVRV